jgi:hypothetical protein
MLTAALSAGIWIYSGHGGATIVNDGLIMGRTAAATSALTMAAASPTNSLVRSAEVTQFLAAPGGAVTVANAGGIAANTTSKFSRSIVLQDGTVTNTSSNLTPCLAAMAAS